MAVKPKTTHSIGLSYPELIWPTVSKDSAAICLELLSRLLEGVGQDRQLKRSHARRTPKRTNTAVTDLARDFNAPGEPTVHEFANGLLVGFNSCHEYLETLAKQSRPEPLRRIDDYTAPKADIVPLVAICVCRSDLPLLLTASLPLLIHTASLASPSHPMIRLVELPADSQGILSNITKLPGTGFGGIKSDFITAATLIQFVRTNIEPVNISWLPEIKSPKYLPVRIESTEVRQSSTVIRPNTA